MDFRILGPLEILEDDAPLDLPAKQRTLVAMLLLHANEVVSADRLIDAVWEDEPPARAAKALQVYISHLRKALGRERVITRSPGYQLTVADDEFDLRRFEASLAEGRPRDALALWRGPPLSDVSYSRFAQSEIARLQELRLSALEAHHDQELAAGRHAQLVGELEALVHAHPLRERLRGQLMVALYRAGRQADALDAYQDTRESLIEGLGIEPGRELRELQQRILNQDPTLDATATIPATAASPQGLFVGRDGERDALTRGLDDAFAGSGRLFLLVGEPGIGKSRLAEQLSADARARGAEVIVGRSWEAGGAPAYWPWVQALRAHVERGEPDALRTQAGAGGAFLGQLVPELRVLLPELSEPPAIESESARFRLFEAVASFLKRAAALRPLVLILDDLHAADEPSLLLLQFVAREVAESRLLIIGAYRDVDPTISEPLTAALVEMAREPTTRTIALAGLDEADVAQFIELSTDAPGAVDLALAVHTETEGNPLFVGEIVRLLAAEGRLVGGSQLSIPQSVRDVIVRRLRHLSEECNRVLVLASVLGREFAVDVLAHIVEVSEDDLLDMLDEAMVARVVSDVPETPGRLRFAHVLIRDALYDGLTTARRVRLHRLAVEALETRYGDEPGPHSAELAFHAVAGSEFGRGLAHAQRAAERATALLAYEEAARLYEVALDAFELSDSTVEEQKCELLLALAEAEADSGNTPVAKKQFLEAASLARRLGLPHALARAAAGYGGRIVWARADDDLLVPLLEEGLTVLSADDVELRVRLLARLAGALRDEPSRDRRDALSREGLELARRTGEPSALAYALDGRAAAIGAHDTAAQLLELGAEAKRVAQSVDDRERVVYAHFQAYIGHMFLGDVEACEREIVALSNVADEFRRPALEWLAYSTKAMLALGRGRLTEAEELIPRALAAGERAMHDNAVVAHLFQLATLYDFQGRLDELATPIQEAVERFPTRPVLYLDLYVQARVGELDRARSAISVLADDGFRRVPVGLEWLFSMSLVAEACAIVGDEGAGPAVYELLLPWTSLNVFDPPEGTRGSVSRYLGLLAALGRRVDDASRHFEHALALNARMGLLPWLAHTQEDYGRMLIEQGDEARGRSLVEQAVATYRDLGMDGPLQRATLAAAHEGRGR